MSSALLVRITRRSSGPCISHSARRGPAGEPARSKKGVGEQPLTPRPHTQDTEAFYHKPDTKGEPKTMAVKVKHHKGKWWVFIDHKGKRKAKCIGTSKRAAESVAEKIQAKISLGQFEIADEKVQLALFSDYAAQWL